MKILGIGVDIVENKRLKNSIKNKSFIPRLFTLLEIKNSRLVKDKSIYFSKKFAAKESFSKALGTGFRKGLNFKDVEISDLEKCISLLKDELKRQQFEIDFRSFSKQMEVVLPDKEASPFIKDFVKNKINNTLIP